MLKEGDKAPLNILLESSEGKQVSLEDYSGKHIVLYFYPKDNTPGCTQEACEFRDLNSEIAKLGAVVLGVSKDNIKSHNKFIDKFELNFPLLSDSEHELAEAFGIWQKKKFMGREYMGMVRSTFIINPDGEVIKSWIDVKPAGHSAEVYEYLKEIIAL